MMNLGSIAKLSNMESVRLAAVEKFEIHPSPAITSQYNTMKGLLNVSVSPNVICVIVSLINLFNFVDRGIIPGSTQEFNAFIKHNIDTNTPDVYLGLLQSAFVVGFVVGSVIFGHMIHHHARFFLAGVGMSMWIGAVFLSGLSYSTGSYTFLIIVRMLSGFGEASLQCTIPPWIESNVSEKSRGAWLSLFYTAIPVGTAVGYTYSSIISSTIGWQYAFFIEGLIMIPAVVFLFAISPSYPLVKHTSSETGNKYEGLELQSIHNEPESISGEASKQDHHHAAPSLWDEVLIVMSSPLFVLIAFANAAQTATLIGVSTFGSAFMMGLGYYDTEAQSSTVFGILISIAGIVGTPVGGLVLDWCLALAPITKQIDDVASNASYGTEPDVDIIETKVDSIDDPKKKALALHQIFILNYWSTLAGVLLLALTYFVYSQGLYLTIITIGCCIIFFTYPAINLSVMLSVNHVNRSLAIALVCIIGHVFGDVPSPIIVGYMKDYFAPDCIAQQNADDAVAGNIAASSECRADGIGLRFTMFLVFIYMYSTVIFFGIAWYINTLNIEKYSRRPVSNE